jgi:hypothetical protein
MDPHLKLASDLLKAHNPLGVKMRAGMKLAGFYSTWYLKQWFNSSLWSQHQDMGVLSEHYQYVQACSHRLARTIFHYMGLYRDKLERKQVLLGHLMDIGTELFAMAATCSYAKSLQGEHPDAMTLADYFCREATRRIEDHYRNLASNDDAMMGQIGKSVLGGDHRWLEEGIQWIGPNA